MPHNWDNTLNSWKQMLKKPKNLALTTGTGVSKAIEAVKKADEHPPASYQALHAALDALMAKCKETKDKFKLFTDAGQLLDTIRHDAAQRKTETEKEARDVLERIKHECDEVYAKLSEAGSDRAKAGDHWVAFKHDLDQGLGHSFPSLQESIKVIQAMLPPNHKDSKQSIGNFRVVIERMKDAATAVHV